MSYRRDGRTWPVGDTATVRWIRDGTTPGLTIDSAIPLVFESYATLALPAVHACMDTCLVDVLAMHGPHPWWLGYLLTGTDDDDTTPDLPPVPLFVSWEYVLVEAGPSQAASWRGEASWRGRLPDLIFPADRSWLVSRLWDDDWRCIGGPADLLHQLVTAFPQEARSVAAGEDATPPGHDAC